MAATLEELNQAILLADQEGNTAVVEELTRAAMELEKQQGYQPKDYDMLEATGEALTGIGRGIAGAPGELGRKLSITAKDRLEKGRVRLDEGRVGGPDLLRLPADVAIQTAGTAVEALILNPISELLTLGGKGILELTPDSTEKAIVDNVVEAVTPLIDSPQGQAVTQAGLEAAQNGIAAWKQWSTENPADAETLKSAFNIAEVYKPPMLRGPVRDPRTLRKKGVEMQREARNKTLAGERKNLEQIIEPLDTDANRLARQDQMYTDDKGRTVYRLTDKDEATIDVLLRTPVSHKNSNQLNFDILKKEIEKRSKSLAKELNEYDYIKLDRKQIRSEMQKVIDDLLDPVTGNPALAGETQAKTAAQLFRWLDAQLADGDITPARLHKLRQEFDAHIKNTKGRAAFEGNETAFAASQKAVRDYLNGKIVETTPLSDVAGQLKDLHLIYGALDVVRDKAAKDADTAFGRVLQNIMRATDTTLPRTPYGKIVTVGALGSFLFSETLQNMIPYLASGAVAGGLGYGLYRGSISPGLRKYLGKTLVTMDQIAKKTKSKEMKEALALDRATIVEFMKLPTADVEDLTEEEKEYEYPEIPFK
jgi:hypothetical protein